MPPEIALASIEKYSAASKFDKILACSSDVAPLRLEVVADSRFLLLLNDLWKASKFCFRLFRLAVDLNELVRPFAMIRSNEMDII